MKQSFLKVHYWPISNYVEPVKGLMIFGIRLGLNISRSEARFKIRMALQEFLAIQLNYSPSNIELLYKAGRSPKLMKPNLNIGISFSHEPGLSICAIHMNGKVGIDLIAIKNIPSESEINILAKDYLGIQITKKISELSGNQKKTSFAKSWTSLEAKLKCQENCLVEWSPSIERYLSGLISHDVNLGPDYIGSIATEELI